MTTDYYHILGISSNASANEIKLAYKALAKKYHPDKHNGSIDAEEKFKQINEAYQNLSDIKKKLNYDWKYFKNTSFDKFQFQTSYSTNYHRNFSFGKFQSQSNENKTFSERNPQKGNLKFYIKAFVLICFIVSFGIAIGYYLDKQ